MSTSLTHTAAAFAADLRYADLAMPVRQMAKRCILDGVAVQLGGTEQAALGVLGSYLELVGGEPRCRLLGDAGRKVPPGLAALWNGTAGHAMDWDDTQLARHPGRAYGLMTHPTVPPLSAAFAIAEHLGGVSGQRFIEAFIAGVEVECKLAEAINPQHYLRGFHSSGTLGTFGAATAAAKLLGLDVDGIRQTLGLAASMAAGIRANFGTMTKPLHVGRAAESGVTAALLVSLGYTADRDALDGRWGYLEIAGPGGEPELVINEFGRPFSIVDPGVSVKPYPSGVLTHPAMDALLFLMREEGIVNDDIERVDLYAANNVLGPIRFGFAETELQGKFCFQFLLAAIMVAGRAGKQEFTNAFVQRTDVVAAQRKVLTHHDAQIESMGYDKIRSRIVVSLRDGQRIERWADEYYRGSPMNPLSDRELEAKLADCAYGLLSRERCAAVSEFIWNLDHSDDIGKLFELLDWGATAHHAGAR
jgi:2-methylcitrate dehydratase PrpD